MRRLELARNLTVHIHASGEGGVFANAYLVETAGSVVAVDATLSETESKALPGEYIPIVVTHACGAGHTEAAQRSIAELRFTGDAFLTTTIEIAGVLQASRPANDLVRA
jgi:hypothetical protein